MSIWDLRQAFESAIPAWVELVAIVAVVLLVVWARLIRKGPHR